MLFFYHAGTCEQKLLEGSMKSARIEFSANGKGVLLTMDVGGIVASTLLEKRVCAKAAADGVQHRFVMGATSSRWGSDMTDSAAVRALKATRTGLALRFQLYVSECAVGPCRLCGVQWCPG